MVVKKNIQWNPTCTLMTGWDHRWFWSVLFDLVFVANLRLVKWILPSINIVWIICSAQKNCQMFKRNILEHPFPTYNIYVSGIVEAFQLVPFCSILIAAKLRSFFDIRCDSLSYSISRYTEVSGLVLHIDTNQNGITHSFYRYRSFTHDFLEVSGIYKRVL